MKQIELAQRSAIGVPGAKGKIGEARAQNREGVLIVFTIAAYGAAWIGSNLLFHLESYSIPLLGLVLLMIGWLLWRLRHGG
jgi:hypothetical protein